MLSMVPMGARKTNIPNKLDLETEKWAEQEDHEDELEIPISDKDSEHDNHSDLSFEVDESRKKVVLS